MLRDTRRALILSNVYIAEFAALLKNKTCIVDFVVLETSISMKYYKPHGTFDLNISHLLLSLVVPTCCFLIVTMVTSLHLFLMVTIVNMATRSNLLLSLSLQ